MNNKMMIVIKLILDNVCQFSRSIFIKLKMSLKIWLISVKIIYFIEIKTNH